MKRLMYKANCIFRQSYGETIIESIISLFVFTILMISVTSIINAALGMTGLAIEKNRAAQGKINDIVMGNGYDDSGTVSFSIDGNAAGGHDIMLYNDGESMLVAFAPNEGDDDD